MTKSRSLWLLSVILGVTVFSQAVYAQLTGQADSSSNRSVTDDSLLPKDLLAKGMNGDLQSAYKLGDMYFTGKGAPRDYARAADWYRKAALAGIPEAQVQMGYITQHGLGVQADPERAAKWFALAAHGDSDQGRMNLGVLYINGLGVHQDTATAFELFSSSARKGNSYAMVYLGNMYLMGVGVERDPSRAEDLYKRAAKMRNPIALYNLASLYSVEQGHAHDLKKSVALFREAHDAGYSPASHSLGLILVNHPELATYRAEGVTLLEESANGGFWKSAAALASMYRDAKQVPQSDSESYRWFRIAVLEGGATAEAIVHTSITPIAARLTAEQRAHLDAQASSWAEEHPYRPSLRVAGETAGASMTVPMSVNAVR